MRLKSERVQHLANVVVSQLNTAIFMAGSFVMTPAILYGLGDAQYGGWLLLNSFISYTRLLDLGTGAGTLKYGAGAEKRGDLNDLRSILDTSAAIFAVAAILTALGTIGMAVLLPRMYPVAAGNQAWTILILGAGWVLDACARPFAAVLRMRSLYFVYDGYEVLTYLVFKFSLVLYFAYSRGLSMRVLALLTLAETVVRVILVVASSFYLSPEAGHINPLRAKRRMVRKLSSMGIAVTVIAVADIVRFQIDAGVIGYFMPDNPVNISIFGVGTRLPSVAFTAIGVIGAVLIPRFSGLTESGDARGAIDLVKESSRITGFVASFVMVNLAVFGPNFLTLWLKKPWILESGSILLLMLPGYYIALLTGPSAALLSGMGRLRSMVALQLVEATVNLALSIALLKPLGIVGVALGTAIPLVLFRGIVFPMILEKEVGLGRLDYARMHLPAIAMGIVYLVLTGGMSLIPLKSYSRLLLLASASTCVYGLLMLAAVPTIRAALMYRVRWPHFRSEKVGIEEERDL
jgi:O-antigen/teichoic acid export membrane protein